MSQMQRMGLNASDYVELEQYAIDCYTDEFRLNVFTGVEILRQEVNSIGVIPFPKDYIKYTKIGVEVSGRIQTLTLDEDLMLNKPNLCGDLTESSSDCYCFVPHSYMGNYYPGLFTHGGGVSNAGVYRIDETKRQIVVAPSLSGKEIIVEYRSSGNCSAATLVPAEAINCMRYYLSWKYYEYKEGMEGKAQGEYMKFCNYHADMTVNVNSFTASEFLDTLYQTGGYNF